ncbi:MAG: SCO family protein [Deltaproteobacteria bacterium]|nr:SCO family protein [Deltaproteobacteria bacterium]
MRGTQGRLVYFLFAAVLLNPHLSLSAATPATVEGQPVEVQAETSLPLPVLQPEFTPPPPGTYSLPEIDTVKDHWLLDSTAKQVSLFNLTAGKIAVISFMYTACGDVGGCPLAAAVLQQIDRLLSARPALAKRVVLLSVSFDPERDTLARLTEVREILAPHSDWHFLTGTTPEALQAILEDFHQPVAKLWQADGNWSGLFRHVLKVYLLDAKHQVRNIYSTGLFDARLVLNDIETILQEADQQTIGQQP